MASHCSFQVLSCLKHSRSFSIKGHSPVPSWLSTSDWLKCPNSLSLLTFYCRYNILIAHYINGTYNKSNKVLFVWGRQCKGLVMCVSECLQSRSDWLKNNWFILTCSHLHSFSPSGRSLLSSTDIMCSGPVFFQV